MPALLPVAARYAIVERKGHRIRQGDFQQLADFRARGRIAQIGEALRQGLVRSNAQQLSAGVADVLDAGIGTQHGHAFVGILHEFLEPALQTLHLALDLLFAGDIAELHHDHILLRQIIPNAVGPLIVLVTLDLGNAILVFAGLSFLGLGTVPPTPEWGSMVGEGRELVQQWWVATFPGLAILTVVMGFNFMGDGFRDWLDPHANRR